ncbi:MAG TPA: APC family permease [Chitinophagaceae bacterium]|nr:APC family permease [Chitinophagaceae bacterium]
MTKKNEHSGEKMSFNATWSMAVGGMVGGGIFSVLGVIVATAGQWAWLSFVIAGLIALVSAHSYSQLSVKYTESGGAYTFLREVKQKGIAATLSWILILGYILTVSVYAFTFGHYVSHVFGLGSWLPKVLAFAVITFLTWINLRGIKDSSRLEIITVWGKLFILLALSLFGIIQWNPEQLTAGIETRSWHMAIVGAATIFMAYEGFQLLSYDYDDIRNPRKNMPKATISAVIAVMIVYVLVAIGATMLVGASALIEQKEIALSAAGQKALGITGLILVTIAAAFSTGSAINATLFSTARLMQHVAEKKDLPGKLATENKSSIPYFAIILIAAMAALLAIIGSLATLVDAASLIFLLTFGIVNFIAFIQKVKYRFLCLAGSLGCVLAIVLASKEEFENNPVAMIVMLSVIFILVILRPALSKTIRK